MTIETFKKEITDATKAYDKFVVCLDKTPEDFATALGSLMQKAIRRTKTAGRTCATALPSTNRSPSS